MSIFLNQHYENSISSFVEQETEEASGVSASSRDHLPQFFQVQTAYLTPERLRSLKTSSTNVGSACAADWGSVEASTNQNALHNFPSWSPSMSGQNKTQHTEQGNQQLMLTVSAAYSEGLAAAQAVKQGCWSDWWQFCNATSTHQGGCVLGMPCVVDLSQRPRVNTTSFAYMCSCTASPIPGQINAQTEHATQHTCV